MNLSGHPSVQLLGNLCRSKKESKPFCFETRLKLMLVLYIDLRLCAHH